MRAGAAARRRNAIYAFDLEHVEQLASVVGDDPEIFRQRRRRTLETMLAKMYDEEDAACYDVCEPATRKIRVRTPTIFFPLAVTELDQGIAEKIVAARIDGQGEFSAPFAIPSVALHDPGLVEASGFREYYDPFTGEGYGARDFTWSGLLLDMCRARLSQQGVGSRLFVRPFRGDRLDLEQELWGGELRHVDARRRGPVRAEVALACRAQYFEVLSR